MIGLTIGIIFLAFFLKKKTSETGTEFCYFPNCRVLKELRSKPIAYSEELQELMEMGTLDSLNLALFLKDGSIEFKQSDSRAEPCPWYMITHSVNDKEATIRATNCDSKVTLSHFSFAKD